MSAEARRSEATRKQLADVANARGAYEARWTPRRLQTVDPSLHARLNEQIDIFDRALFHGDADEIERQGEATVRGWRAATKAMEAAGQQDDAYLLGCDPKTGVKVAIGEAAQGADRVRQVYGDEVIWLTPDEVATLYAATEGFSAIDLVKRRMPGAEVVAARRSGVAA